MNLYKNVFQALKKAIENVMKTKIGAPDKDYLKRCKSSSPETKLEWLMSALTLAQTKKKIIKR